MKSARAFTIFLLLGFMLAAPARADKAPRLDPKRIINDSFSFLKNQEPEMAADEYAMYEKAVSLIAVRPEFGLKLLESLVSSGEHKSPAFELALGNVYYSNNQPALAEKYFRAAIEHYPEFQRAWNNLAALLYAQGRYAEAIPCFTKVTAAGKADAATLGILAYCQARTGNALAAEMNYVQALGLDPTNPDWIEGLLSLALEAKQYGRAESLLKQLIRVKPQDPHNWVVYASVLNNEGRPLEAIAMLDAAASLGYASDETTTLLGDLCAEQKLYVEAVAAFRQIDVGKSDLGAQRLISFAQSLTATGDLSAAASALAAVRGNLPPETQMALFKTSAELAVAKQDWPTAQKEYENALQIHPLAGDALLSLGRVYKQEGNRPAAELILDQASRVAAVAYPANLELGELALASHHYARAIDYLEKALSLQKTPTLQRYIAKLRLAVPDEHANGPAS